MFAVAVSGALYCIIRTPPLYGANAKGKPVVFSSGGRDQYVLEGAVVGLLNVAAAAGVIGLVTLAKRRSSDLTNVVVGGLCIALFATMYSRVLIQYMEKTRWYSLSALWPKELTPLWVEAERWVDQQTLSYLGYSVKGWSSTLLPKFV
jgi:hypothetical protein